MSDDVHSRRRYDSPRRREQAVATRRKILDAARELFESEGYERTSIASISVAAGVSIKTVYLAFANKSGVLTALWNLLLRGDDDAVPVGEREWFQKVLSEPDPAEQLRLNVHNATTIRGRIAPILEVIRGGAPSDPEVAALWARIQKEFYANQRTVIESIASKGVLRKGLDVDRATDILWTVNSPAVHRLLTVDRGWTADQYEQWLTATLREQLFGQRS